MPLDPLLTELSEKLGMALQNAGLRLTTAESCTGGLVAAAITELAGASDKFERGYVTYSNAAKHQCLGVPLDLIDRHGAVSEAVARAMAEGARAASGADVALAITGIAGPDGGSPDKPVGTVCFGWSSKFGTRVETRRFTGNRHEVRIQSAAHAMRGVLDMLDQA